MRTKTQDPKFDIEDGKLINAGSGEEIPEDEPVFILRGKDIHAVKTLQSYLSLCGNPEHKLAIESRIGEFESFAAQNPGRMKEPDTNPNKPDTRG